MEGLSRKERERQARETDILDAAERVFIQSGFDGASMDEIAEQAQFTRRTVYQYFTNKESLYYAVCLRGFRHLYSYVKEEISGGKNSYEKLQRLGSAYYRFYKDYPDVFRLMNYVGYYFSAQGEDTFNRREYIDFVVFLSREIAEIINQGKLDGSIRSDIDADKTTYSIEFLLSGFFQQLSISGKTFMDYISLNPADFVSFVLNLLFDAFKPVVKDNQ